MDQLDWMGQVVERYGWAGTAFKYAEALALNGQARAAGVVLAKLCKTQTPKLCLEALDEWRSDSEAKYPEFREVALPTVMRKIVEHGIADEGPLFAVKPRLLKEFRSGKSRA